MKVLILEDHREMASALEQLLQAILAIPLKISIHPTVADLVCSGIDGDLLIADLNLPDSEPCRTALFLSSICNSIKIICHSGFHDVGENLAHSTNHQIAFVKKGVERSVLLQHLSKLNQRDLDSEPLKNT